jgi:glucokinase
VGASDAQRSDAQMRAHHPAGAQRLVGLDLGGTAIKAGAIARDGTVLEQRSVEPHFERGVSGVLDVLAQLARDLGAQAELGIGVPGLLVRESGWLIHSPNLPGFRDIAVKQELADRLGFDPARVHVENDANAAALGEQWLGAAKGIDDLLLLTLGTGIGGGLILGGELFAGRGMAGEIGHVVIDPTGPVCGCGARGCLEMFASARAATLRAKQAGLPAKAPGDLKQLTEIARERDGDERRLLLDIGRDLGRGIGPVVCLLDLGCFVFGGGFAAALEVMEPGIRAGVDERSYGDRGRKLALLGAQLGPQAGWIGAARLCL